MTTINVRRPRPRKTLRRQGSCPETLWTGAEDLFLPVIDTRRSQAFWAIIDFPFFQKAGSSKVEKFSQQPWLFVYGSGGSIIANAVKVDDEKTLKWQDQVFDALGFIKMCERGNLIHGLPSGIPYGLEI